MTKRTHRPMTWLIDDRPGEEAIASANTAAGVATLKKAMPHLREVTKAEYLSMEHKIAAMDGEVQP